MSRLAKAAEDFRTNVQAVLQLSDLDRGLLDVAIQSIEERDQRLRRANVENWQMLAGSTLESLKRVREHDSLRPGFQALVDQSVVLLASHFSSGMADVFKAGVAAALEGSASSHLKGLQLKLSVADLAELASELGDGLPGLVADAPGISFQDTKSIARTFADFFEVEITRDEVTNDITAGLAFRHVLVHNGGVVDRQCQRQVQSATPRTLRPRVVGGHPLKFESEEVALLARSMTTYVERLCVDLRSTLGPPK